VQQERNFAAKVITVTLYVVACFQTFKSGEERHVLKGKRNKKSKNCSQSRLENNLLISFPSKNFTMLNLFPFMYML